MDAMSEFITTHAGRGNPGASVPLPPREALASDAGWRPLLPVPDALALAGLATMVALVSLCAFSHTLRRRRAAARLAALPAAALPRARLSLDLKRAAGAGPPPPPPRLAAAVVQPDNCIVCGLSENERVVQAKPAVVVVMVDARPRAPPLPPHPQPPVGYPV